MFIIVVFILLMNNKLHYLYRNRKCRDMTSDLGPKIKTIEQIYPSHRSFQPHTRADTLTPSIKIEKSSYDITETPQTTFMNDTQLSIMVGERCGTDDEERTAAGRVQVKEYQQDVPSGFSMTSREHSPAPPENGVIDTSPATTTKTGFTAFTETVYRKHRLPPSLLRGQQLQVVPAVQFQCSVGRDTAAVYYGGRWGSCTRQNDRRLAYAKVITKEIEAPDFLWIINALSDFNIPDRHVISAAPDGLESKLNAITWDKSTLKAGASCLHTRPVVLITPIVLDSVVSHGFPLISRQITMPLSDVKSSKARGSKIAELKRFFDSQTDEGISNTKSAKQRSNGVNNGYDKHKEADDTTQQTTVDTSSSVLSYTSANGFYLGPVNSDNSVGDVSVDHFPEDYASIANYDRDSEPVRTTEKSFNNNKKELNSNCVSKYGSGLWKNVDVGLDCENTLWDSKQLNVNSDSHLDFISKKSKSDLESNIRSVNHNGDNTQSFATPESVTSTAELNTLIAASRAQSLKQEADILPEKSTLENYFAYAFENSKPQRKLPPNHMYPSSNRFGDTDSENADLDSYCITERPDICDNIPHREFYNYECGDMEEMMFDDLDDVAFSDTSSEEDIRYRPSPPNIIHTQPFALHTIMEESCEESERESNTATPTNQGSTSNLEKYFSWDIVNNINRGVEHRDGDDNSTVYSDSLSEASNSSNDDNKNFEPDHLSSSRLETYFTTGLIGNNQNYDYPDDAEFLDDVSEQCSDFDEDDKCQKISRSALLSSLETPVICVTPCVETFNRNCKFDLSDCDTNKLNFSAHIDSKPEVKENESCVKAPIDAKTIDSKCENMKCNVDVNLSDSDENGSAFSYVKRNLYTVSENSIDDPLEKETSKNDKECESSMLNRENDVENTNISVYEKNEISKHSLAHEDTLFEKYPEYIVSKIISLTEISENNDCETQTDCNFAWRLLEEEIEQLMKNVHVPPITNGSSNSSTFGSSNSDYGSDTVDSGECLTTDEDDNCVESKSKKESNKCRKEKYYENEHVEFWKKFLQSFNKGELQQSLYTDSSGFSDTQSYIREHIIAFMSMLTSSQDKPLNSDTKSNDSTLTSNQMLHSSNDSSPTVVIDEGISIDSTENLYSDCETVSSICAAETNLSKKVEEWYSSSTSAIEANSNEVMSNESAVFLQKEPAMKFCIGDDEDVGDDDVTEMTIEETFEKNKNPDVSDDANISLDDSASQFSVYVDIEIGDESTVVTERQREDVKPSENSVSDGTKRSSLHFWVSEDSIDLVAAEQKSSGGTASCNGEAASLPIIRTKSFSESNLIDSCSMNDDHNKISEFLESTNIVHRDTGYYSFKSSDDSILGVSEFVDKPIDGHLGSAVLTRNEFEESHPSSIRSSIKSNISAPKTLSSSTTNIPASSNSELRFNTLQPKPKTSKVSMNPRISKLDYRPGGSYFSPVSALKKLLPSRMNSGPRSEISYPSKYLKKYGRSFSVDEDSIFGATSMPHLNHGTADTHGIDSERDNASTDDELEDRPSHSRYTQSIISLGAHSASTTSVYSAAGGCHFGYVTVSGDVLFGLNYNQKSQTMEVFVKQCRNLAAIDTRKNRSDPYVKVYLLPDKTKAGKRKTKTKRNTLSPVFNELLRFPVLKNELESRTLWLSVWNSDLFGRNDFLGEIMLALGYRLLDSPTLRWYPLQERAESFTSPLTYKGEIYLALKYVPKDLSLEPCFRAAPVIALRGALHVLVKEARNINVTGGNGTLDAFCKSYLLPDKSKGSKQKTPVVRKSRHPKWYYTIIYEDLSVEELKERSLELTVWDHDKITSNDFLGAVRLNTGTGLYHGVPVDWMDSARDESSLWLAMLQRPNMWVDGSLSLRPSMQSIRC